MAQPPFAQYGQAVSAHLRHATRREKAQVQKELTDHLKDHAEALTAPLGRLLGGGGGHG